MAQLNMQEAVEIFGDSVVHEVMELVGMSDPDGVWSLFSDMGMDDHVECVEFMYFE